MKEERKKIDKGRKGFYLFIYQLIAFYIYTIKNIVINLEDT